LILGISAALLAQRFCILDIQHSMGVGGMALGFKSESGKWEV
jgi:hypothetical protein